MMKSDLRERLDAAEQTRTTELEEAERQQAEDQRELEENRQRFDELREPVLLSALEEVRDELKGRGYEAAVSRPGDDAVRFAFVDPDQGPMPSELTFKFTGRCISLHLQQFIQGVLSSGPSGRLDLDEVTVDRVQELAVQVAGAHIKQEALSLSGW